MPVTARRTSLLRAVSQLSSTDRPTGRTLAKHRRTSKPAAPRAAAAVLSVGLAVGGVFTTVSKISEKRLAVFQSS